MAIIRKSTIKSMLAHLGFGLGGFGLARYLANPARAPRYRPGFIGQLAMTVSAAAIGGSIVSMRTVPASVTEMVRSGGNFGALVCRCVEHMGPCANDRDCNNFMQTEKGLPLLTWYNECRKRAMSGGFAAAEPTPNSIDFDAADVWNSEAEFQPDAPADAQEKDQWK
ncbi:hypothetical protein JKP88DRAFT_265357 [Tribonema minus]|uniref:Uncharacterized protein n=1 Tax=Tribonema minus TaxID=303371 RepID=A0A835YJX6_9STRA|nr:hypothetical protein JKP88DRAFT_265357 [Tribonema minus]